MIINSLQEYYDRLRKDPQSGVAPLGFSNAKVAFAFNLSSNGELLEIFPLYEVKGKKKILREMLVPEQIKKTSGVSSNFLCENSSYVLGIDNKGKKQRTKDCFTAFKELHSKILSGVEDHGAKAVIAFLNSREPGQCSEKVIQDNIEHLLEGSNIVFKLDGQDGYIHERPLVKIAWENYQEADKADAYIAQCLVTGEKVPIALLHPSIKGVVGAQSSGASIVSFNDDAYVSYRKRQSYNAPVSKSITFAYTTALNYLLANPKNRLRIGDATTVFWAEREQEENLIAAFFDPPEEPNVQEGVQIDHAGVQKIRDILMQLREGRMPANVDIEEKTHFSILGLAPNAARISIRYYCQGEFGTLMKNIGLHYADMSIVLPKEYRPLFPPVWRILKETAARGKTENIPPILGGGLMRAILSGGAYPQSLYSAILSRIRADYMVNPIRAGVIKACLLRQARIYGQREKEGMIRVNLNEENTSTSYLLGRLFALLEIAQRDSADNKINATIVDRYYGTASVTPAAVFPVLIKLSKHHLRKIKSIKPALGYALDKKIQEVINALDDEKGFPRYLNLDDQGFFVLGYHQQKQHWFTKQEEEGGDNNGQNN
jgi:CRISPR-associated protein Csd1